LTPNISREVIELVTKLNVESKRRLRYRESCSAERG
jgi:hypothetical protein